MLSRSPSPDLLTVEDVARRIGICKRRVLTELVRHGLLPWPEAGLFRLTDVEALEAHYAERRARLGQPPAV